MPICIYATVTEPDAPAAVNYRVVVTDLPGVADAAVLECRTTDALGDETWARVDPMLGYATRDRILRATVRRLVDEALQAGSHRVVRGEGGRVSINLGPV